MKVIIDTNGLMTQAQWGVDVFDELIGLGYNEFVVPSAVKDELESLRSKVKGDDRVALAIAAELMKKCEIVEARGYADDIVEKVAKDLKAPVFTNDAILRMKLKKAGIKTIFLRGKQKLVIE